MVKPNRLLLKSFVGCSCVAFYSSIVRGWKSDTDALDVKHGIVCIAVSIVALTGVCFSFPLMSLHEKVTGMPLFVVQQGLVD
jgi:hypothetical protein